jgi:flagellar basal body-associated protein FliL
MNFIKKVFNFYLNGFKTMGFLGKKLWIIILIKLFVLFVILRLVFFPNFLNSKFKNDSEKGDYVIEQLTKTK